MGVHVRREHSNVQERQRWFRKSYSDVVKLVTGRSDSVEEGVVHLIPV